MATLNELLGSVFKNKEDSAVLGRVVAGLNLLGGTSPGQSSAQQAAQSIGLGIQATQALRLQEQKKKTALLKQFTDLRKAFGGELSTEQQQRALASLQAGRLPTDIIGKLGPAKSTGFFATVKGKSMRVQERGGRLFVIDDVGKTTFLDPSQVSKPPRSPLVQIGGGDFKVPMGYKRDPIDRGAVVPIPGGPAATLNPEQAAKAEAIQSGIQSMSMLKELLFEGGDPIKGEIDRSVVNLMALPFEGFSGDAQTAMVLSKEIREARIRGESGAAVPDTEVVRMAQRFQPRPWDRDITIRAKLIVMDKFLKGTYAKFDPTGIFQLKSSRDAVENDFKRIMKQLGAGTEGATFDKNRVLDITTSQEADEFLKSMTDEEIDTLDPAVKKHLINLFAE